MEQKISMERKMRQGAIDGALIAILIILTQPFQPTKGLIPELVSFLVTVPLWLSSMLFQYRSTAIVEGASVIVYFIIIGSLVGVAFDRKRLWGWLILIALAINHYVVYDQYGRQMGEVVQTISNYLG